MFLSISLDNMEHQDKSYIQQYETSLIQHMMTKETTNYTVLPLVYTKETCNLLENSIIKDGEKGKPDSFLSIRSFASAILLKQYSLHSWKGLDALMQSGCTVLSFGSFKLSLFSSTTDPPKNKF